MVVVVWAVMAVGDEVAVAEQRLLAAIFQNWFGTAASADRSCVGIVPGSAA